MVRGLFLPPNKTFFTMAFSNLSLFSTALAEDNVRPEGVLVVITGVFNMFPYENSAFLFVAS
jgi:hypothetical protein